MFWVIVCIKKMMGRRRIRFIYYYHRVGNDAMLYKIGLIDCREILSLVGIWVINNTFISYSPSSLIHQTSSALSPLHPLFSWVVYPPLMLTTVMKGPHLSVSSLILEHHTRLRPCRGRACSITSIMI